MVFLSSFFALFFFLVGLLSNGISSLVFFLSISLCVEQNSVLPYLLSDDYRVRKQAATSCARMAAACVRRHGTKGPSAVAVEEVLTRLLEVVVADASPQVTIFIFFIFFWFVR
jgi:hypothetical protein